MKTLKAIIRKFVEMAPVVALIIAFALSSAVLPTAIKYTSLRLQIHRVEAKAAAEGYYISATQKVEDWGDGRREKYNNLTNQIEKMISTSKVAELCNEYGAPSTKNVRDIVLLAIGAMWLLSGISLMCSAYAEFKYWKRMLPKRQQQKYEKIRERVYEQFGYYRERG